VLDLICELDEQCAQFVVDCRKKLWPDYHEMEAKRDEERERQEAEEKKRRAKVTQITRNFVPCKFSYKGKHCNT
jgi:hypothetical protein